MIMEPAASACGARPKRCLGTSARLPGRDPGDTNCPDAAPGTRPNAAPVEPEHSQPARLSHTGAAPSRRQAHRRLPRGRSVGGEVYLDDPASVPRPISSDPSVARGKHTGMSSTGDVVPRAGAHVRSVVPLPSTLRSLGTDLLLIAGEVDAVYVHRGRRPRWLSQRLGRPGERPFAGSVRCRG